MTRIPRDLYAKTNRHSDRKRLSRTRFGLEQNRKNKSHGR